MVKHFIHKAQQSKGTRGALFIVCAVSFCLCAASGKVIGAQVAPDDSVVEVMPVLLPMPMPVPTNKPMDQPPSDILRLEETIRGNKEQPKVLSIVPWQLPLYQRIDPNGQVWAPLNLSLKPIERSAFLKQLAVLNELQNVQKNQDLPSQNEKGKD